MEWWEWGIVIVGVILWLAWKSTNSTPSSTETRDSRKLSNAGHHTPDGILTCPRCGGTNFKAKRSAAAKVGLGLTIGLGALLAPKTRVKCVTCGKEFLRG